MIGENLPGQMMSLPLTVSSLLIHAARYHGDTEIVSRRVEGDIHRYTYAEAHRRTKQLANALHNLGVNAGDRIGTLAWNGYRHFELYYAISGMGAVTHTVNPRLFSEQVAWIVNDAEDRVVFFDSTFDTLVETIAPKCPKVEAWVAMCDDKQLLETNLPNLLCYEELLQASMEDYSWPALDENSAAALCYTSGTTGNPKGVLYSHRSTVLHALSSSLPDSMNLSATECVLPVVPMFHVNAWGIPYSAPLVGAKLVFPGASLDGQSLCALFESENITFTAGVPTIWLEVLQYLQNSGTGLSTLRRMVVGGAACPQNLMQRFAEEHGIQLQHAWGMTELSPLGALNSPKYRQTKLPDDERKITAAKQGRPPYGIDLKIVDDNGCELPRDGCTAGELFVRGQWVINEYFGSDTSPLIDGWFPTGDVATLDADGYMQITDRAKDVIKSGGEWISSIELENIAMEHPDVVEAAAMGIAHPKWDERPLIVVVAKAGKKPERHDILSLYEGKVARFCIPDDVVFFDEIPHTATGKVSKLLLRKQLENYCWPAVQKPRAASK